MARIEITPSEVAAAFEKLIAQNEAPSAENIQKLLGKSTVPVIQGHIQTLIQNSNADLLSQHLPHPASAQEQAPSSQRTEDAPLFAQAPTENSPSMLAPPIVQIPPSKPPTPTPNNIEEKIILSPRKQGPAPKKTSPQHSLAESRHLRHGPTKQKQKAPQHADSPFPQDLSQQNFDYEATPEPPLESLSKEQLLVKVKRLESFLLKEQSRRETADRIAIETKDYADKIKEQVAQRINDLRQNMDVVVEQLKAELREQKQAFAEDLKFYQTHLNQANHKLMTGAITKEASPKVIPPASSEA